MYSYMIGKVTGYESNSIFLEVNNIGYHIYVANPFSFTTEGDVKVFLYHHIREEEQAFYGFNTLEEKELFLRLISVKGVGPKLVMPMLATGSVKGIIDAIDRENILYLKKFPKVGDKVARQIILDLKGKLMSKEEVVNNSVNEELASVLEGLGYKMIDIKKVIPNIDSSLPIEMQIKEALKLLLK